MRTYHISGRQNKNKPKEEHMKSTGCTEFPLVYAPVSYLCEFWEKYARQIVQHLDVQIEGQLATSLQFYCIPSLKQYPE